MVSLLALALLVQTPLTPQVLSCFASFGDGARTGNVSLLVDGGYRPYWMRLWLYDTDGWTKIELELDPNTRKLPGRLSYIFGLLRFSKKPAYPLALKAYADGQLRWQQTISVPFWPTTPLAGTVRPGEGTVYSLGHADDGLPVSTPHELHIIVTDAEGRPAGELSYPLLTPETEAAVSHVLAAVETSFDKRSCSPPPPPPD